MSWALTSSLALKSARGARANQAFRKSRTSRTSELPERLKSAAQGATSGTGHGLGVQERPESQLPALARHRDWVSRLQTPESGLQHAAGTGQVFGVQVPPAVQSWAAGRHAACVWIRQVPVTTLQQTPCGGGQGLGEQTPDGIHVFPVVHRV